MSGRVPVSVSLFGPPLMCYSPSYVVHHRLRDDDRRDEDQAVSRSERPHRQPSMQRLASLAQRRASSLPQTCASHRPATPSDNRRKRQTPRRSFAGTARTAPRPSCRSSCGVLQWRLTDIVAHPAESTSEGFPRLEYPSLKTAAHRQIANRRALRRQHRSVDSNTPAMPSINSSTSLCHQFALLLHDPDL